MNTKKDIIVLTGAGQLGMAIVRRMAYGNKIFVADWKLENAQAISKTLVEAGFDAVPFKTDISSRASILELIAAAQKEGEISMFVNAAGLSPSQSTKEHILAVDLYGTAVLLEEFGKVIKRGGSGVTISSQSGYRMPALMAETVK
jgi:NAD(P)-dependent dehydrogenase (short-subunit alcohol dehydrogenase family)